MSTDKKILQSLDPCVVCGLPVENPWDLAALCVDCWSRRPVRDVWPTTKV